MAAARTKNTPASKPPVTPVYLGAGLAGAAVLAAGAAFALIWRGRRPAGHPAPDLAIDRPHPTAEDRAPDHFRPDPTAPVPESMRESLRPATGPAPSMVQDRGAMRAQTGPGTWPEEVAVREPTS